MQTFIAAIIVFCFMILFHELGHFSVAKLVGVKVHEFSLGFGPKLWGKKVGETDYNLRAFPLGGFVRMAGMDPNESEESSPEDEKRGFNKKKIWQRASVIAAGPIMNFVLAIFLLAAIFMFQGLPIPTTDIGSVIKGSPAAQAGVKAGDKIVAINGTKVNQWEEMIKQVNSSNSQELQIDVLRKQEKLTLNVKPKLSSDGKYKMGITSDPNKAIIEKVDPFTALWKGTETTWNITVLLITFIGKMFAHQAPVELGGPVRVVTEIGNAAKVGVYQLTQLAAFLSINLGLFNLFPIPALDGSRLLFLGWEKVVGKPVDPAKEGFIHMLGFGLLLLLMVVITYKDVLSLVTPGGQ